jgi:hypothetical protein
MGNKDPFEISSLDKLQDDKTLNASSLGYFVHTSYVGMI